MVKKLMIMAGSWRTTCVHSMAVLFGVSSWIALNGVWVELPLLITTLPESWRLASFIVLITQLANVGPLVYSLLKRLVSDKELIEKVSIHVIFSTGLLALFLLSFTWDSAWPWLSSQYSVPFLTLTFMLAFVDCTSSVTFLPFMSRIPSKFLISHLFGQALSGLMPSFIALAQGVGGNAECQIINGTSVAKYPEPLFPVQVFFLLLCPIVILSWLAFIGLTRLKSLFGIDPAEYKALKGVNEQALSSSSPLGPGSIFPLLTIEALCCTFTNGVMPAVQPYSVLSYGNLTYHYAVTLAVICSPIGCLLTSPFFARRRIVLPSSLAIAGLAALYIFASALSSPVPLVDHDLGRFLIVLAWMLHNLNFALARSTITSIFRHEPDSHRLLFLGGVFTQLGSFLGAILMFFIVNQTNIFVSVSPCPGVKVPIK